MEINNLKEGYESLMNIVSGRKSHPISDDETITILNTLNILDDERTIDMIKCKYGIGVKKETYTEIAKRYNLSITRPRQIVARGLRLLHQYNSSHEHILLDIILED